MAGDCSAIARDFFEALQLLAIISRPMIAYYLISRPTKDQQIYYSDIFQEFFETMFQLCVTEHIWSTCKKINTIYCESRSSTHYLMFQSELSRKCASCFDFFNYQFFSQFFKLAWLFFVALDSCESKIKKHFSFQKQNIKKYIFFFLFSWRIRINNTPPCILFR